MTKKEKIDQIEIEIKNMYHSFFKEEKEQNFKSEEEANEFSKKFHKKLFEFIKEEKKKLKINDNTR